MHASAILSMGVYPSSSDEVDLRMAVDTSEDGTGSNTILTTTQRFKATTERLIGIGCRPAHLILSDPEPFYSSFNLEASDLPLREKKPEHFQILDGHCSDAFGPNHRAMSFKYDRLSAKDVFCELTITLPDERRCSYKTTSPRTDDKWAQQAVCKIALENGVLDFIKSADIPETSNAPGGLVVTKITKNQILPVDTPVTDGPVCEIDQVSKEMNVDLHWVATKKPNTPIDEFGCILHIQLADGYQKTWSVPHTMGQPLEAKQKLAEQYKEEVISYIKDSKRLRTLIKPPATLTPLRTISAAVDASATKDGPSKEAPVTLDTFFTSLGSVPHELEVRGKTQARQPISWLHAQTQAVKGAKQPDFHFTWSQGKYHGCLLRLEAPNALPRSYLVDAMFTKKQDAKTAVCLLAAKEHCEEYLQQTEPKRREVPELSMASLKPLLNSIHSVATIMADRDLSSRKEANRPGNDYPNDSYMSDPTNTHHASIPPQPTLPLLRFSVSHDGSINQSQIPTTNYCLNQRLHSLPHGSHTGDRPLPPGRHSGSQNAISPTASYGGLTQDRFTYDVPSTSLLGGEQISKQRAGTVDSSGSSDPGTTVCGEPSDRTPPQPSEKPPFNQAKYDGEQPPYSNRAGKLPSGELGGWGNPRGHRPPNSNRRDEFRVAGLPPRPPPHEPRYAHGQSGQKRPADAQGAQNHITKKLRIRPPNDPPPPSQKPPPILMPQHEPKRIKNITELFKFCREAHARTNRPPTHGSALPQFHHIDHGASVADSQYEVWIEYKDHEYKDPDQRFGDCWDGWDQLSRKILDYLSPKSSRD